MIMGPGREVSGRIIGHHGYQVVWRLGTDRSVVQWIIYLETNRVVVNRQVPGTSFLKKAKLREIIMELVMTAGKSPVEKDFPMSQAVCNKGGCLKSGIFDSLRAFPSSVLPQAVF